MLVFNGGQIAAVMRKIMMGFGNGATDSAAGAESKRLFLWGGVRSS